MAKRRKSKKDKAKAKRRKKRGKSALALLARKHGMTIKQLKRAIPACGKWSVRRRKSSKKKPCR